LNNIYALARKKSDDTANVVMKLSKLLRFMLYESRKERIPVSAEIRMIEDYLELEKIRYNERLTIRFEKDLDDTGQHIAPLLLLPFIENAFKHGASETRFDSFIHIRVHLKAGQLKFCIENSKEENGDTTVTDNIGLSNVRRQLELMYQEHTLQVDNQKSSFTVHLTINLNNDATLSLPYY
jgi:two-component system, LytTR family, sensor kinase